MSSTLFEQLQHTVTPAMATPLDASGYQLNESAIEPLVNFLLSKGAGGIFPGGTTGEGILLPLDQRKRLHALTMTATAGRVPVLLHIGCNNTRDSVMLAEHAASLNADAIVAVTPYFYPVPNDALLAFFASIAEAAPETPLLVYDIPHFANNGITPELVTMLSAEIPTFAGVKCSRRDSQMIRQLVDALPDGKLLLAGNEPIMIGSLAMGAHGAISGLSTAVPEPFVAMVKAFGAGDIAEAQRWHGIINQCLGILKAYPRIGYIKRIINERGIAAGDPMLPRPAVSAELWPLIEPLLG